ncbi:MAG: hypothetical protein JWS12_272 [Candidatus Saccharibacteria bacterium]|nr:hypothetical protein [Candidatus Saccharibacteria bacterium]
MLWIVGKAHSSFYEYLRQNDEAFGIFLDAQRPTKKAPQAPTRLVDFTDETTIQSSLKNFTQPVEAIVWTYENYVWPAAQLSRYFSVPGITPDAALSSTDKVLMRQKFLAYDPSITPEFKQVDNWQDILDFMQAHSFPVILKPANLVKSLLVSKSDSIEQLQANFQHAKSSVKQLYSKFHVPREPKLLIEECLVGSLHTVAGFADSQGRPQLIPKIVDLVTAQDIGRNDNYLFTRSLPSRLKASDQKAILTVAAKGGKALGLTSTPLHIELFLTPSGPKIIEIGARIGGYRTHMYEVAHGINLEQAMIDTAYNRKLNLAATHQNNCSVIELFPESEGVFQQISNLAALQQLPSFNYIKVRVKPGRLVGPASSGYKAAAIAMLIHTDPRQLQKDLTFVQTHAKVLTGARPA